MELRVIFHIAREDSTCDAKMANVTGNEFPNMNHLFQPCKMGVVDEYATIEQTINPFALEKISGSLLKQTK